MRNGKSFIDLWYNWACIANGLIEKGNLSMDAIGKITKETARFDEDEKTSFYTELTKIFETVETEEDILEKSLDLRETLLNRHFNRMNSQENS